ncbi:MAG: bifunctional oligoribonuclease/PAP phosphatase NrnA [Gemmatimonadota bacterium]
MSGFSSRAPQTPDRRPPIQEPDLQRQEGLHRIRLELLSSLHVVLTTHLNADGDGAGSEAAVAHYLRRNGVSSTIVNPTPFPDSFRFLLGKTQAWTPADEGGRKALAEADKVLVLDTAEPARIGALMRHLDGKHVMVLDHHPPVGPNLGQPAVRDARACATGELVYDLITADGGGVTEEEAAGLYVAIVTDTGSFRFSNTSPRALEICAELLRRGVDPEDMFRRLYGQRTVAGLAIRRRALAALSVDEGHPIASIRLTHKELMESGASSEDLEGIVDIPRQLAGIEVAVFLRELPDGKTKASLRSNGSTDVAAVARELGGGGHVKAAGVLMSCGLDEAERQVVALLRAVV